MTVLPLWFPDPLRERDRDHHDGNERSEKGPAEGPPERIVSLVSVIRAERRSRDREHAPERRLVKERRRGASLDRHLRYLGRRVAFAEAARQKTWIHAPDAIVFVSEETQVRSAFLALWHRVTVFSVHQRFLVKMTTPPMSPSTRRALSPSLVPDGTSSTPRPSSPRSRAKSFGRSRHGKPNIGRV